MAASNGTGAYTKERDVERGIDHNEVQRNGLTNTVTLSSEMFENLYLSPKNQVSGDLRKTFANPTPIAIMGFVVGLTPLSCEFSEFPSRVRLDKSHLLTKCSGLAWIWRVWSRDKDCIRLLRRFLVDIGWHWRVHHGEHLPIRGVHVSHSNLKAEHTCEALDFASRKS